MWMLSWGIPDEIERKCRREHYKACCDIGDYEWILILMQISLFEHGPDTNYKLQDIINACRLYILIAGTILWCYFFFVHLNCSIIITVRFEEQARTACEGNSMEQDVQTYESKQIWWCTH